MAIEGLSLEQLQAEFLQLQEETLQKDWRINLILDNLPILFFYCDKDEIFEVLQGDGMSKMLLLHEYATLYELFNDFPTMFEKAESDEKGQFREKMKLSESLSLGIEYGLVRDSEQEIQGIVGFINAFSKKKSTPSLQPKLMQAKANPNKDRLLKLLNAEDNKLDLKLIKESLNKILQSEVQLKLSQLLIKRNV